jgi:hypothetical protein
VIWRCVQCLQISDLLAPEFDGVQIYENYDIMIMEERQESRFGSNVWNWTLYLLAAEM